jgi:hypothetical protein
MNARDGFPGVTSCSLVISITMPRIMIDPSCPFRLKPRWTRLDLDGLIMVI